MKFTGTPFVHDGRIATPIENGYLMEEFDGGGFERVTELP